jgi:hypothetical protein
VTISYNFGRYALTVFFVARFNRNKLWLCIKRRGAKPTTLHAA